MKNTLSSELERKKKIKSPRKLLARGYSENHWSSLDLKVYFSCQLLQLHL